MRSIYSHLRIYNNSRLAVVGLIYLFMFGGLSAFFWRIEDPLVALGSMLLFLLATYLPAGLFVQIDAPLNAMDLKGLPANLRALAQQHLQDVDAKAVRWSDIRRWGDEAQLSIRQSQEANEAAKAVVRQREEV